MTRLLRRLAAWWRASRCPQCRRVAHFVCGNPTCRCVTRLPRRVKPLVWLEDGMRQACGYCGYVGSADYWEDRSMRAVLGPSRLRVWWRANRWRFHWPWWECPACAGRGLYNCVNGPPTCARCHGSGKRWHR